MRSARMPQFDRDLTDPDEVFTFVVASGDPGDRKDPERCVFARCAKRTMRTDRAWFGLTVGYAELNGEIVRFGYTPKLAKAIRGFDDGTPVAPGVYMVAPIKPSATRTAKTERNKKYNTRNGMRPQAGRRRAWHAPRGWGRGIDPNGTPA